MNIELRQLRYFVAVSEEMHFGRAAARLHMTQPPLSQTIMALEAGLGTALFVRTKRSVALTPAGAALLPEARRILLQAEALPELARRAACGASGRLTLAFVSTADYNVLPAFLRDFHSHYPQVQIELLEATSDVQLEELLQGRVDAGFYPRRGCNQRLVGDARAFQVRHGLWHKRDAHACRHQPYDGLHLDCFLPDTRC